MKVSEIAGLVEASPVQNRYEDTEITACYTSDLLSDVMANAGGVTVLITIQAHKNTVAVASLNDIRAILVCNDRPIPQDMISSAANEGIAIFRTHINQFQASGRLYAAIASSR